MYFDTAVYDSSTVMCGYRYVGASHLLFATDYPFGPGEGEVSIKRSIEIINELEIKNEEKEMIFGENASKLLKL
jgi:predicted TIM-barrel fold metal-dependent hydrolase